MLAFLFLLGSTVYFTYSTYEYKRGLKKCVAYNKVGLLSVI